MSPSMPQCNKTLADDPSRWDVEEREEEEEVPALSSSSSSVVSALSRHSSSRSASSTTATATAPPSAMLAPSFAPAAARGTQGVGGKGHGSSCSSSAALPPLPPLPPPSYHDALAQGTAAPSSVPPSLHPSSSAHPPHRVAVSKEQALTLARSHYTGRRHPCLRQYKQCDFGHSCCFSELPYDACLNYVKNACPYSDERCHWKHSLDGVDMRYLASCLKDDQHHYGRPQQQRQVHHDQHGQQGQQHLRPCDDKAHEPPSCEETEQMQHQQRQEEETPSHQRHNKPTCVAIAASAANAVEPVPPPAQAAVVSLPHEPLRPLMTSPDMGENPLRSFLMTMTPIMTTQELISTWIEEYTGRMGPSSTNNMMMRY